MRLPLRLVLLAVLPAAISIACVTSDQIRTSAGVVEQDLKLARKQNAMKCAPRELATGEAQLTFALGELDQGNWVRAKQHIDQAETAGKKAVKLSLGCVKKVHIKAPEAPPVIVKIEEKDTDNDGILDKDDNCPEDPEDKDGFEDDDGCPDLDNDADGIPDIKDRCPMDAGIPENEGCPAKDSDDDGIFDHEDKCPDVPGVKEEQGCPRKYTLVELKKDKIEIKQKVFFQTGKWRILPRSYELLNQVASVLKDHPKIMIRIEGHTDSQGSDSYNLRLSQKRSESVRNYLVGQGVDGSRLEAAGFGETRPIASNATRMGREQNRRVEFFISEQ